MEQGRLRPGWFWALFPASRSLSFLVNVDSNILSALWKLQEVISSPVGLVGVVGIWSRTGLPWASWDGLEELSMPQAAGQPVSGECSP